MWTTMGYNDGGEFNIPDSFNGRKLRPLVPRPNNNSTAGSSPPCLGRLHGADFFALNHHLANMADQGKREFNTQPAVVVSSRWNPTPEQLRTLEELYRRGTRTPSADQIQHITAQLRRYGKIEGKNVFYWFQNHKARERQKRRRQMESSGPPLDDHQQQHQQQQHGHDIEIFERKESSGASRTLCYEEGEQTKDWAPSTNCTALSDQESVSLIPRAATKAGVADQCRSPDGWIQFDEAGELLLLHQQQHRSRNFIERNATWQQMMQLSCPSPTTHLINTSSISSTATATTSIATTTTTTTQAAVALGSMDPTIKLINKAPHDLNNIFIAPCYSRENGHHRCGALINHVINEDQDGGESQTLQLFPLRSDSGEGDIGSINEKETTEESVATPCQFFEFLPLKN